MFKRDSTLVWVYVSHEVHLCLCLSVYIPAASFVPLQQHTLIKPPRMNLFYYWILSAGEYPKCVWVPLHFMRWCSSVQHVGTVQEKTIRWESFTKDGKIGPEYVALFPLGLHSLQQGLTEDGFTYYHACACQWARHRESITHQEKCEGHTNARSSQVTNEAITLVKVSREA